MNCDTYYLSLCEYGDTAEIKVNDKLTVNITRTDCGYVIDAFDRTEECINSLTVFDDELETDEEEEE